MEYIKALENELAQESFIDSALGKIVAVVKFVGKLIMGAINFLRKLLNKILQLVTRKENIPATKQEVPIDITAAKAYDCTSELSEIVSNIDLCVMMLTKRPLPTHKQGKDYDDRWMRDNEVITEKMENCLSIIDKLEIMDDCTINYEMGKELLNKLEVLSKRYNQYGNMLELFVKKNAHLQGSMIKSMVVIQSISNVATKTMTFIQKLVASV